MCDIHCPVEIVFQILGRIPVGRAREVNKACSVEFKRNRHQPPVLEKKGWVVQHTHKFKNGRSRYKLWKVASVTLAKSKCFGFWPHRIPFDKLLRKEESWASLDSRIGPKNFDIIPIGWYTKGCLARINKKPFVMELKTKTRSFISHPEFSLFNAGRLIREREIVEEIAETEKTRNRWYVLFVPNVPYKRSLEVEPWLGKDPPTYAQVTAAHVTAGRYSTVLCVQELPYNLCELLVVSMKDYMYVRHREHCRKAGLTKKKACCTACLPWEE